MSETLLETLTVEQLEAYEAFLLAEYTPLTAYTLTLLGYVRVDI